MPLGQYSNTLNSKCKSQGGKIFHQTKGSCVHVLPVIGFTSHKANKAAVNAVLVTKSSQEKTTH